MPAIEKTRTFKRDHPIDCRGWREFVIVESDYRSFRIRYTVDAFDASPSVAVQLPTSEHASTALTT